jgi:hypothetical protein
MVLVNQKAISVLPHTPAWRMNPIVVSVVSRAWTYSGRVRNVAAPLTDTSRRKKNLVFFRISAIASSMSVYVRSAMALTRRTRTFFTISSTMRVPVRTAIAIAHW